MFKTKCDSDRYRVRISKVDVKTLTAPKNKWVCRAKSLGAMLRKALITFLTSILIVLAMIAGAAPASAAGPEMPNPFQGLSDVFQNIFCSVAMHPDAVVMTGFTPSSAEGLDPTNTKLTILEKYGATGGLVYVLWEGPRTQKEMDGEGTFAGKKIVNMAGGPQSGIETWGDSNDANDKEATAQKGFFDTTGGCQPFMDNLNTGLATSMLQLAGLATFIGTEGYAMALNSGDFLENKLGSMVTSTVLLLKNAVFLEFLAPITVVSALWMAWVGLVKRQSTQMAQGLIWMVASSCCAIFMMVSPFALPNAASDFGNAINEKVMSVTSKSTTGINGDVSNYCQTSEVPAVSSENVVREFSCTMWFAFAYTPWVEGQFGQSPAADDVDKIGTGSYEGGINGIGKDLVTPPRVTLGNTAAEPQTWALHHFNSRVDYEGANEEVQDKVILHVAANQLYKDNYNKDWKGDNSAHRVSLAFVAFLGALAFLILVGRIVIRIITLEFGIIFMILFSPVFFLVGVHPGYGRRIGLGWLEKMVGMFIKSTVLKIYLSVVSLVLANIVTSGSSETSNLQNVIILIALACAAISYEGQFTKMFDRVNFGSGGMALQGQNEEGKFSGLVAGLGTGLLMGAGGKAAQGIKNKKNIRQDAKKHVNQSSSAALPRPANDTTRDSGPSTSDTNGRSSDSSAGSGTSTENEQSSRRSGPFNPEEQASEERSSENQRTEGAGARPTASDTETAPGTKESEESAETFKSDGAGSRPKNDYFPEDSSYIDTPATRKDRKEQIKFEAQQIRDERLRSGVAAPSVLGAAVKGAVGGYRAGSAMGGVTAGAGAAQSETQKVEAENEARRRAAEAQWEADQRAKRVPRNGSLPPLTTSAKKDKEPEAPKDKPSAPSNRGTGGLPDLPGKGTNPKAPGAGGRPS